MPFKKGCKIWLGRKHTEKSKIKMSKTHKKSPTRHWLGKKLSDKAKLKMSLARKGKKHSKETKKKISLGNKGKHYYWLGKFGKNHPNWKGGIDYRDESSLFNPLYVNWRSSVFSRDNWKCRIADKNCSGQLEAHHILPWRDYPELRFEFNNGITLCHAHHPRKRAEEKLLIPAFQGLVRVSSELLSQ